MFPQQGEGVYPAPAGGNVSVPVQELQRSSLYRPYRTCRRRGQIEAASLPTK